MKSLLLEFLFVSWLVLSFRGAALAILTVFEHSLWLYHVMQITTDFNAYLIVILFFFWKNLWPFASVSFVFQNLPIASVPGPWYTCSDG